MPFQVDLHENEMSCFKGVLEHLALFYVGRSDSESGVLEEQEREKMQVNLPDCLRRFGKFPRDFNRFLYAIHSATS